jgi:hypothetical protein
VQVKSSGFPDGRRVSIGKKAAATRCKNKIKKPTNPRKKDDYREAIDAQKHNDHKINK